MEDWFGEPFDEKLAHRIANMPEEQKVPYLHSFPLVDWNLPEVQSGKLRPVFATTEGEAITARRLDLALRLLMYSHEVVLDAVDFARLFGNAQWADTFRTLGSEDYVSYYERLIGPSSVEDLKLAIQIRPLVENGTIRFSQVYRDDLYFTYMQRAQFIEVVRVTEIRRLLVEFPQYRRIHKSFTDSHSRDLALAIQLEFLCSGVSAICQLAAARRAHALAGSKLQEEVIRSFLQRPTVDAHHVDLKKLAALNVPAIGGDVSSLVNLRRSDDDFAQWRDHLSRALTRIGELSDEESIEEAEGILYAELSEGLSQVNTAVRRSPALQAAKAGLTGFVISGISGTTAEVMTNNPWVGLAAGATGAAAGTVLDAGLNYVKALQARRKGRLIMDVAMLFDPQRSDE